MIIVDGLDEFWTISFSCEQSYSNFVKNQMSSKNLPGEDLKNEILK